MKILKKLLVGSLWTGFVLATLGCGAAKDKVNEVSNDARIKGHWLMTGSEHANAVTNAVEKESLVLTFRGDKAAFSPTDTKLGIKSPVFIALPDCDRGPRTYKTENNDVVFPAEGNCPAKRYTVQTLNNETLKFPDGNVTRTFRKITQEDFETRVSPNNRRLQ